MTPNEAVAAFTGYESGRAEERAVIVAFLRRGTDRMVDIAGRIERGDHLGQASAIEPEPK